MARYIFIFLWTPALTSIQRAIQLREVDGSSENAQELLTADSHGNVDELPFGWIFSSFMVCCMLGTMAFSYLTNLGVSASKSLVWILALSAVSCLAMAAPSTVEINSSSGALYGNTQVCFCMNSVLVLIIQPWAQVSHIHWILIVMAVNP
jgi:hypothetical protein